METEQFKKHIKDDADFQKKASETFERIEAQLKRLEPMIKLFEENKIVKARLGSDAKTIILYAGGIATVGGAWYVLKAILTTLLK